MDASFERALQKIPAQLRERPGARFTVIINGQKRPEGKNWAGVNGANYSINDAPLAGYLEAGHNFGVLCGHAGINVADIDDPDRMDELGISDRVPNTFMVWTGRGGRHVYLDCPELDHQIGIYDPVLKDEDGEPLHLGEIQSKGQQVVGPGSTHPNSNKYVVVNDVPILKISKADLLKIFNGLILTGVDDPAEEPRRAEKRRRKSGGSSIGDLIQIDQVAWPKDIKKRTGSEVVGSHPLHGSKNGENFSVNTSKNCWHCFRAKHNSGGGPLEWLAVEAGLIRCEDAKPGCLDDKDLFKKVLQIAKDRGFSIPDREGPKAEEQKPNGPTVLTALQTLLDNEDKITGECAWEWRLQKKRIEKVLKESHISQAGEKKAHKFLKQFKSVLEKLGIDYYDLYPLLLKPRDNKEEFSDDIKTKALDILKNGDPVQYITDSCGKMVLGADKAFKKLTSCVSTQNINQSYGLHPKLNGDSSGGKTITVYTFAHHLPKEAVIKGSMSAKSGFYHKDGNRVLRTLDDYQDGNEDLDTVIKQTSSDFHSPYQHRTVANHEAKTLTIGSEQTWAITSVDSSQEIQVLNRQLPINVDDSLDLTMKVNNLTVKRYCDGERQYPVTEQVLVSRCIMQILRDEGYIDIRIPFGDRIEWKDTSNRRNPSIFMDLVIANTAMFRYQREKDAEGFYLATEDDYNAAKALFTDKDGEELVKKLTKKERETLDYLVATPEGITQDDLAEHLKVSRQRAGQILYGQQKGSGGLMGKVPIKETKLSEMKKISDDERRTTHKTLYSLKDYDKFAGFDAVVRLKPQSDEPGKPCNGGARDGAREDTASRKDSASNESKKEKERKKREIEENLRASSPDESKTFHGNENKPCKPCTMSLDGDDRSCTAVAPPLQPLHHAQDSPLICAVCGADLTGHGHIQKGSKFFCAKVGCGYPAREKNEAKA